MENKKIQALMITPVPQELESIRVEFQDEVPFYPNLDRYQIIVPEMFIFGNFELKKNRFHFLENSLFFSEDTRVLELYRFYIANKNMKIIDSFYIESIPNIEYSFQAYREAKNNLKKSIVGALHAEKGRIDMSMEGR